MKPIEKNIIVIDEQGNEYEATYPKRAKGLVKNGRARFIDENTICLACPPNDRLEDNIMSENEEMINVQGKTVVEAKNYNIDYVLQQIEKIASQTDYLNEAITQLSKVNSGIPGDIGAQGVSNSLSQIIMCRETTNQRLIAFYEKMYDDLKPNNNTTKEQALNVVLDTVRNCEVSEGLFESLYEIIYEIKDL